MFSIAHNGLLLSFEKPKIMAIININENSFYANSRTDLSQMLTIAEKHIAAGAHILDIGVQSSRPGANLVDLETEITLISQATQLIKKTFPQIWLSIDTFRSEVAHAAIQNGANIINDISAGAWDLNMLTLIAKHNIPYIAMHVKGKFENRHEKHSSENIVAELIDYFAQLQLTCKQLGIYQWILDPGFGFSKSMEENFQILRHLESFQIFQVPILAGISRKRMIWQTLGTDIENSLNGTIAANTVALLNGAKILRVHDTKAAVDCISIFNQLPYNLSVH